jgi:hypothetical protein
MRAAASEQLDQHDLEQPGHHGLPAGSVGGSFGLDHGQYPGKELPLAALPGGQAYAGRTGGETVLRPQHPQPHRVRRRRLPGGKRPADQTRHAPLPRRQDRGNRGVLPLRTRVSPSRSTRTPSSSGTPTSHYGRRPGTGTGRTRCGPYPLPEGSSHHQRGPAPATGHPPHRQASTPPRAACRRRVYRRRAPHGRAGRPPTARAAACQGLPERRRLPLREALPVLGANRR